MLQHDHAVGDLGRDAQVMRDEDHRKPHLAPQLGEQRQHLRLDRHVERGYGLVGDQHLRPQRERARNADALALAAREFVRIAIRGRGRQPDARQQLPRLRHRLGARGAIGHRAARHGVADLLARIEAGERILEYDLQPPARLPQCLAVQLPQVVAAEPDRAGIRLRQPHDHAAKGRLAGAGLADNSQRLALMQRQRDAVGRDPLRGAAETSRA